MIVPTTVADLFTRWDIPWLVTLSLPSSRSLRAGLAAHSPHAARAVSRRGGSLRFLAALRRFSSPSPRRSNLQRVAAVYAHGAALRAHVHRAAAWSSSARRCPCSAACRVVHPHALRPLFAGGVLPAGRILTRPRVAWLAMNAAYVGWHIPRAYEFALASETWHDSSTLVLFTNLMFWWPMIRPWPTPLCAIALAADSLSAARRRRQHSRLGISLLFGPIALSEHGRNRAPLRPQRAQRPGRRRSLHVGMRVDGVSRSCGGHRRLSVIAGHSRAAAIGSPPRETSVMSR